MIRRYSIMGLYFVAQLRDGRERSTDVNACWSLRLRGGERVRFAPGDGQKGLILGKAADRGSMKLVFWRNPVMETKC